MEALNDLAALVEDWTRQLRSSRRSVRTQTIYASAARTLIEYLRANGLTTSADKITRKHLDLLRRLRHSAAPAEAGADGECVLRLAALRAAQQLFRWLTDMEEAVKVNPVRPDAGTCGAGQAGRRVHR